MSANPFTVLVLCTGNSARSILGEALFAELGQGRIRSFSAGSKPKGVPHPAALRWLGRNGIDPSRFHSKSWDVFAAKDAPAIDWAITVCGNAAGETCPVFAGAPVRAHWGLPDPADVADGEVAEDAAFAETARLLEMRIRAALALPLDQMTPVQLRGALNNIGQMEGAA